MKKLTLTLIMMLALVGFNANAAMYLVGNEPLGEGWDPSKGIEMTDNGDSTYTYDVIINGEVWFCFAEALANNWDVFNGQYRYGPTGGTNQTVTAGEWITTQKQGNGSGSYYFRGSGDKYTVTFSLKALQFKIDGYVEPITEDTYTVAGGNAAIFGTAWAPGEAANDMTLDPADGLYKLAKDSIEIEGGYTLEYKVCKNHGWGTNWGATPNGDNQTYTFNEGGTYNIVFLFDLENETVSLEATKIEDGPVGPVIDPITGDLFILGQVNSNNWNPSTGIEMETADEDVYTLADATFTDGGDGYAYFSFTSKIGVDENDWSFGAYRRGAEVDGTEVVDGESAVLADWGSGDNAFKVLPGIYDVEVGLSSNYVKLVKKGDVPGPEPYEGDVYILGEVNENGGWFPNVGTKMVRDAENKVYTATITTAGENDGYSYFSFTKKLSVNDNENGGWDEIAGDRFGATVNDFEITEALLGEELGLANAANAFKIPAGTWDLTLSVDEMTLVIAAVAQPVGLRGDVNGDENVSIADVTALIDYLLSHDATNVNLDNADCNQDQNISIADVTALIDYLLSHTWN
ncbi:MAG: hypothetical protein IJK93_03730 [Muribaculaceae bacterium]|nr:hypothetical protein [Muribaculaceae bacterium]